MITGKPGGSFTGSDANNRAVTYGFGYQFNITPAVGVRVGWDKYKFNDNTNPGFNGYGTNGNATLVSIGGLLKFWSGLTPGKPDMFRLFAARKMTSLAV